MILLNLLEVSLTCTCMMNWFYSLSRSCTPDSLSCKHPVGQSSFTEKVLMITSNKRIILQINGASFQLHCQIAILIMTMKTPEHFAWNDLNGWYELKRFENETERFGDGKKRFKNKMKRFGNRMKCFENGTLLRFTSTVQSLLFNCLH